ncbi:MAG: DUF5134 domain-containing protein [Propionibacteriaceae bacterium]
MFAFADTPVKFVGLLILFAGCTVWSVYELTRPQDWRQRISNGLHLVMAVVMLLMVAPVTWHALIAVVPTSALVGVFALSTGWFVWLVVDALRAPDQRGWLHFLGHAAMFGAMTWHLSAMAVMHAGMPHASAMNRGSDTGMDMGQWMAAQSRPGGTLWIVALVGIPFMTYLVIASLRALQQAVRPRSGLAEVTCPCGPDCTCGAECPCSVNHLAPTVRDPELAAFGGAAPVSLALAPVESSHGCHELRAVGSATYRLEAVSAFAMSFGMFWMSTGLLVAILPFFALFAF